MQNKLPQYWAIKCPKNYETNSQWIKVINYLGKISKNPHWSGNSCDSYYGCKNHSYYEGTFCEYSIPKESVELTIEQFIEMTELFVLPKLWFVKGGGWFTKWIIKWEENHPGIKCNINGTFTANYRNSNSIKPNPNQWDYDYQIKPGYVELTEEQFKSHFSNLIMEISTTQTISKINLKEIHDVACPSWQNKFQSKAKKNPFSPDVKYTNQEVTEMFLSAQSSQIPILEKFFKRVIEDKNAFVKDFNDTEALKEISKKLFEDPYLLQIAESSIPSSRIELKRRSFVISNNYTVETGTYNGKTWISIYKK